MTFSLRTLMELIAVIAVFLSLVIERERGRSDVRREFQTTGVIKTHARGAIVPLDDKINIHVINNLKSKPGKAVVEVWDCAGYPGLMRSLEVDVTRP